MAKVNEGLGLDSLAAGLQLAACVRSIEDHGFLLSLGIQVTSHRHGSTLHLSVWALGLPARGQYRCRVFLLYRNCVLTGLHALILVVMLMVSSFALLPSIAILSPQ